MPYSFLRVNAHFISYAVLTAVFLWRDMMFGKEQLVKMRLIGKIQPGDDLRDRVIRFQQILFRLSQREGCTIFKQRHSRVFFCDAVEIVTAVAQGVRQFMAAETPITFLEQMRQPCEDQKIISIIDLHLRQVKMLRIRYEIEHPADQKADIKRRSDLRGQRLLDDLLRELIKLLIRAQVIVGGKEIKVLLLHIAGGGSVLIQKTENTDRLAAFLRGQMKNIVRMKKRQKIAF